MLLYKNGKIYVGNISFTLPDNFCFDLSVTCVGGWGLSFISPDRDVSLYMNVYGDGAAYESVTSFVHSSENITVIKPVTPVTVNGLPGFDVMCVYDRFPCYELHLDLPEKDEAKRFCFNISLNHGTEAKLRRLLASDAVRRIINGITPVK